MTANFKRAVSSFIRGALVGVLIWALAPALLYLFPCGGVEEQLWLDEVVVHLEEMRACCDDPDLCDILDYTIERYNTIGPFDVSVQWTVNFTPVSRAIAYNCPWFPGLTLDHWLLEEPIEYSSVILVHEALHDYYPWVGHSHITDREAKLHRLSMRCR